MSISISQRLARAILDGKAPREAARALLDKADAEGRDLSADEQRRMDAIIAEIEACSATIYADAAAIVAATANVAADFRLREPNREPAPAPAMSSWTKAIERHNSRLPGARG